MGDNSQPARSEYDVLIVGGGLVGASFAVALSRADIRAAIVEAVPFAPTSQTRFDVRPLALSLGSRKILEGLGLWDGLQGKTTPIRNIHVSDRGHFGVTRLSAAEEGVDALGYVTDARSLGGTITRRLSELSRIDSFCPARVARAAMEARGPEVNVEANGEAHTLRARLLVAADGGRSVVREMLGIGARESAYRQTAITATVTPHLDHCNTAYERFTDTGPLALLPLDGKRCGLIWTVPFDNVGRYLEMEDDEFLRGLEQRFGSRLGGFLQMGRRHHYPLSLIRADEQVRPRLAIVGNAAHTLHPVAGQGFNLGLRDVAALAEMLVDAARSGRDVGEADLLQSYGKWRQADQRNVTFFTDSLVRLFSNRFPPLAFARNMGLLALDLLPPLKHDLARHAMGLAGRQTRLTRGLPL